MCPCLLYLAAGAVVGDVLLERLEFAAEVVDAPLKQVADGPWTDKAGHQCGT
jgi:hypothetical protein